MDSLHTHKTDTRAAREREHNRLFVSSKSALNTGEQMRTDDTRDAADVTHSILKQHKIHHGHFLVILLQCFVQKLHVHRYIKRHVVRISYLSPGQGKLEQDAHTPSAYLLQAIHVGHLCITLLTQTLGEMSVDAVGCLHLIIRQE